MDAKTREVFEAIKVKVGEVIARGDEARTTMIAHVAKLGWAPPHDVSYLTPEARAKVLRLSLDMLDADKVILISEVWTASRDPEEHEENDTPPSEDPNRVEAVMVTIEEGRFHGMAIAEILTAEDGSRKLGPWKEDMNALEGRLTRLLPGARRD